MLLHMLVLKLLHIMLLLSLLDLLLNYDNLVNFVDKLFAEIYFLQVFSIFSENFQEKLYVPLVVELKSFLDYGRNCIVSILVKHYVSE